MPRTARKTSNWNVFQREHKGKYSQSELKRRWQLHKQGLLSAEDEEEEQQQQQEQQAGDSNSSPATVRRESADSADRPRPINTLQKGLKALVRPHNRSSASLQSAADTLPAGGAQTDQSDRDAALHVHSTLPQLWQKKGAVADTGMQSLAVAAERCAAVVASSTTSSSCYVSAACSTTSSPASTPASHNKAAAHTWSPHDAAGADSSAAVELSPCSSKSGNTSSCSASPAVQLKQLGDAPVVEQQVLVELRQAVHHLLAQQGTPLAALPANSQQQTQQQVLQQQQPPPQHALSQPVATASGVSAAAVVDVVVGPGCFGRGWGSRVQSWNAVQKACKGWGLTRPQVSAVYQHAKQHWLATGEILDLEVYLQQLREQEDLLHLALQQQGHQQQQQQQQQQQSQQQGRVSGGGRWGTLQHWLHSRSASRAASRVCSTAVSPNTSPARFMLHANQQHQQEQGQQEGGGKWGAFKQWLHSRSGSRATSRLGTPAAMGQRFLVAGAQQPQQQRTPPPQQQQLLQTQLHRSVSHWQADADTACMPFAPQLYQHAPAVSPQAQSLVGVQGVQPHNPMADAAGNTPTQHHNTQETPLQLQRGQHVCAVVLVDTQPLAAAHATLLCAAAEAQGGAVCEAAAAAQAAGSGGSGFSSSHSGMSDVRGHSHHPQADSQSDSCSSCQAPHSAAAAAAAVGGSTASAPASQTTLTATAAAARTGHRIGPRLARETVPDNLPGLLEGFSPWVAVDPHNLTRFKQSVPARPGLYEWGVRLPVATGSPTKAANAGHAHVKAFYLGKAGSLQAARPRRTLAKYSSSLTAGETLRSRLKAYCVVRAGKLGPFAEPRKAAFFQQHMAAGGKLYCRWRVANDGVEPAVAETRLLKHLDYAANLHHNNSRRPLMTGMCD